MGIIFLSMKNITSIIQIYSLLGFDIIPNYSCPLSIDCFSDTPTSKQVQNIIVLGIKKKVTFPPKEQQLTGISDFRLGAHTNWKC